MNQFIAATASRSALEPMVRKLASWARLSEDDRAAVMALPHVVRTFGAHDHIIREGDPTAFCCLMLAGFSIRHKSVINGGRQIVAVHLKGEIVDLQNALLGRADHSVQMLTGGRVAMIPRREIIRLAYERPTVGKAMWTDTLVDASIFREWIANVGRRDSRTRLAHLLCEFALRLELADLGERSGYQLPMTQDQLADATGMTSVHLNRTLKGLEAEGLIDRATPRAIHIGDWRRLAEVGQFDSAYLHLDEQQTVGLAS